MAATTPQAELAAEASQRVLVVDDDELDRLAIRRCLQQSGMTLVADDASGGAEALALAASRAYDCIVLDYYIPGTNTVALMRSLNDAAAGVPVVILTGQGGEEVAVEFMKAGAVDYLPKGALTPQRLARSLRSAVDIARAAADKRQALAHLSEREAEFRTLANAIPQLAWMADSDGRRFWYNDRWYEYTGLRPDQCLGLGWHLVHHPDRRSRVVEGQRRAFERGEIWEDTVYLRRADGQYRWFLARAMPVKDDQGRVLRWVGTLTDISDRQEAERAVAASEERFRRALEIETVGVLFFDTEGAITGANDAFLSMSGYSRGDLEAGRVRSDELTPPEFMPHSLRAAEEFKATGRTTPYEKQYIRKDGSRRWALFTATRLSEHEGVEFVVDISAQKNAQLEQERLFVSARSARDAAERATKAREDILAIVAHDLRSPMQTIFLMAQLLSLKVDDDNRRHVGIIERAAQSMSALLSDLLDVARMESGTFAVRTAPLDLGILAREAIELFQPQAVARDIALSAEIDADIAAVAGDPERLPQVLSNLLGNAVKFSESGNRVRVRIVNCEGGVQVSVKDSGRGIPLEDLPRIFDRYWQAERASRSGAGLGLAICKGIVEAHGGRIWAASSPSRGTTVYFRIPAAT